MVPSIENSAIVPSVRFAAYRYLPEESIATEFGEVAPVLVFETRVSSPVDVSALKSEIAGLTVLPVPV